MELMLRKFRLPKIKNCLLEEYNQKALLGVSLFCFGSNVSVFRITVAILRNLENKLPAGNMRKLLMELMLRKFRLPKIKNCLLEEYNQKALFVLFWI